LIDPQYGSVVDGHAYTGHDTPSVVVADPFVGAPMAQTANPAIRIILSVLVIMNISS
jgi:hypothetical protein